MGASAKSQTFGNLSYSQAVALLAVPAEEREKGGDNRAAGESVAAVERRYMMNEPEEAAALSVKIRMAYK